MILHLAIFIEHRLVTNRRTDVRTEDSHIPCHSYTALS